AEFPDDASSQPLPSLAENAAAGFLVSTARLNGEVAARIWLPDSPGLDAIGVRAVEHASIVVALELLRIRTGAEAEHRLRGELLVELLGSPNPPAKALIARAGLLGHDLAGPHIAMVGSAPDPNGGQFYQRVLSAVSDALRGYRP